jgi:superfamily II DNA or RNA helicase
MNTTHAAKNLLQEQIKDSFIHTALSPHPFRIAIYSSTGSGKSKAAIECGRWYYDEREQGEMIIATYTETDRDHKWQEELNEWATGHALYNATRVCYASLGKIRDKHFVVAIMDEAHKMTKHAYHFFRNNTFGCLIILTATRPRSGPKRKLIDSLVGTNMFHLKVDEGVDRGITNDYRIHKWMIDLDDTTPYVMLDWKPLELFTEQQAYKQWILRIHNAKHPGQNKNGQDIPVNWKWVKVLYILLMEWLANTKTKMDITRYLIEKLRANKRRFVVFCHNKAQCNVLGPYRLYSGTSKEHFHMFLQGEIDEIMTIRQIQEGANMKGVGYGVVMQLDTNPLNMIQKNGRFLRMDADLISHVSVPVLRGTFDESWALKAMKGFDKKKIITHTELKKQDYWL